MAWWCKGVHFGWMRWTGQSSKRFWLLPWPTSFRQPDLLWEGMLCNWYRPKPQGKLSWRSLSQVFCVWYVHHTNYFSVGNKGAVLKCWFKTLFVLPTVLIISDSQNYVLPTFEIADRTGDHSESAFGVQASVFHTVIGLLFLEVVKIIPWNIWKIWNHILEKKCGRETYQIYLLQVVANSFFQI